MLTQCDRKWCVDTMSTLTSRILNAHVTCFCTRVVVDTVIDSVVYAYEVLVVVVSFDVNTYMTYIVVVWYLCVWFGIFVLIFLTF